jgi:hypothetical protein
VIRTVHGTVGKGEALIEIVRYNSETNNHTAWYLESATGERVRTTPKEAAHLVVNAVGCWRTDLPTGRVFETRIAALLEDRMRAVST